jgi:hypothetical protein
VIERNYTRSETELAFFVSTDSWRFSQPRDPPTEMRWNMVKESYNFVNMRVFENSILNHVKSAAKRFFSWLKDELITKTKK